jgi:hypothetical protein
MEFFERIAATGVDFVQRRLPVFLGVEIDWSTADGVGEKQVIAIESSFSDTAVEELTGSPNKRALVAFFGPARRLTDEGDLSPAWAFPFEFVALRVSREATRVTLSSSGFEESPRVRLHLGTLYVLSQKWQRKTVRKDC